MDPRTVHAKPIRVKSEVEFERLLDRIDAEVSHAHHHWDLLKGLEEASGEYYVEMNESNTFWHLTFIAHRDAVLSHLGRLYDSETSALSLARFIETVRANRAFFSDDVFRERLKGNPHVETLVQDRMIDDAELDKEIESVSGSDPLVAKLREIRNTVIAHNAADEIRRDTPAAHRRWLPYDDIETLMDRGATITRKYSLHFRASLYGGIAGSDDYKSLLRWLRKALESHRSEIEKQIGQISRTTQA